MDVETSKSYHLNFLIQRHFEMIDSRRKEGLTVCQENCLLK